jgi:hypothetical protein
MWADEWGPVGDARPVSDRGQRIGEGRLITSLARDVAEIVLVHVQTTIEMLESERLHADGLCSSSCLCH